LANSYAEKVDKLDCMSDSKNILIFNQKKITSKKLVPHTNYQELFKIELKKILGRIWNNQKIEVDLFKFNLIEDIKLVSKDYKYISVFYTQVDKAPFFINLDSTLQYQIIENILGGRDQSHEANTNRPQSNLEISLLKKYFKEIISQYLSIYFNQNLELQKVESQISHKELNLLIKHQTILLHHFQIKILEQVYFIKIYIPQNYFNFIHTESKQSI
jgi:flagellar motor switch protein FliM